jgi:hypothetical protein
LGDCFFDDLMTASRKRFVGKHFSVHQIVINGASPVINPVFPMKL